MVCLKIDRTYIGQSIGKTCQISWETSLSMNPHVRLLVGWLVLCFVGLTSKLPMLWYLWNLTNYQCRGSFLQLTSQGPQWCLGLQVYLLIYICHYHILIISKCPLQITLSVRPFVQYDYLADRLSLLGAFVSIRYIYI